MPGSRPHPLRCLGLTASLALAFTLAPGSGFGESPTDLLTRTPPNLDRSTIAGLAAAAFRGRKWTVRSTSEEAVVGHIDHRGIQALLELRIQDDRIVYVCADCTKRHQENVGGVNGPRRKRVSKRKPYVPLGWIHNLRVDIQESLSIASAGRAATPPTPRAPRATRSARERLEELEALHERGLVNDEEFEAKRSEILEDL